MGSRMKLSTKLIGGFVAVAIITAAVGAIGWWGVGVLNDHVHEIGDVRLPSVSSMKTVDRELTAIRVAQRSLLNPNADMETREMQYEDVENARQSYHAAYKRYEPLPQTDEEAVAWDKFVPAVEKWADANDRFFDLAKELDKTHVLNPDALRAKLELFRGDHYKLEGLVGKLLQDHELFDGGESATQCNYGQWLATFDQSEIAKNPALKRAVDGSRTAHDEFHEAIREIKKQVAAGDSAGAADTYINVLIPDAEKVFASFRTLIDEASHAQNLYREAEELAMGE